MDEPQSVATVIRVLRYDTLQIRTWCPVIQARAVVFMTPAGVWCEDAAKEHIVDWCEIHSDAERLKLVTFDYMRDDYGRLIANLADLQSGETLSDYLVKACVAKARPHHLLDAFSCMLTAGEVEDAGW